MSASRRPVTAWCLLDGKAGHANQVHGLLAALRRSVPVNDYPITVSDAGSSLRALLTGRFRAGDGLPDPDLVIGAGHATHWPLLAARHARGGRAIVLMKPGLPLSWFDLCVVPRHDGVRPRANTLETVGVLNRAYCRDEKDATKGLFLVGGSSPHVNWSDETTVGQIMRVLERSPGIAWQLVTSRRTPAAFLALFRERYRGDEVTIVEPGETGPDWLPDQLAAASRAWVTDDSVSMVYEALTAGAAVGLLSVEYKKENDRLVKGLRELQADGRVVDFGRWRQDGVLPPQSEPLDEAGRCAQWIIERCLNGA